MQFKNKHVCSIFTTEQRNLKQQGRCRAGGTHRVLASYFQNEQVKMIYLHNKY